MRFYPIVGIVLTILLASCGPVQPTLTPPTETSSVVIPSATLTVAPSPTATSTRVPPTATATATSTATSTLTPTPTATSTPRPTATPTFAAFMVTKDTPPLPAGKGALLVTNHYGQGELVMSIGGQDYRIPASGRAIVLLTPGHYTFSLSVVGLASKSGAVDIPESYYVPIDPGQ